MMDYSKLKALPGKTLMETAMGVSAIEWQLSQLYYGKQPQGGWIGAFFKDGADAKVLWWNRRVEAHLEGKPYPRIPPEWQPEQIKARFQRLADSNTLPPPEQSN